MNENVILLIVNDDANVNELMDMGVPMSTAYRFFSRKKVLIDSYEKAHKALAKIRLKRRKHRRD